VRFKTPVPPWRGVTENGSKTEGGREMRKGNWGTREGGRRREAWGGRQRGKKQREGEELGLLESPSSRHNCFSRRRRRAWL
jgi:hypothetical protein